MRQVFGAVGSDRSHAQRSAGELSCSRKWWAMIKRELWFEYCTAEVQEEKATSHSHGESTTFASPMHT